MKFTAHIQENKGHDWPMRTLGRGIKISPRLKRRIYEGRYLYLLMLPGILYFVVFKYLPMWMLCIAFQDYSPYVGVAGSKWVGLKHFIELFRDDYFYLMFRNTLAINFLNIIFAFPLPIILALMLNEVRTERLKRVFQTLTYLPHFMSWVIVASMTFFFLSVDVGVINKLLASIGRPTISFLSNPKYFWIILTGQNIWKDTGWGTIIFLAAIALVDMEQYEAAIIDGASKFQRIWYITIPAIMPTIITLLILKLGTILNVGFEQVLLMSNPSVNNVAEVFDTYSYRLGILQGNISFGTAVSVFKGLVGCVFVWCSDKIVKKMGYEGLY